MFVPLHPLYNQTGYVHTCFIFHLCIRVCLCKRQVACCWLSDITPVLSQSHLRGDAHLRPVGRIRRSLLRGVSRLLKYFLFAST